MKIRILFITAFAAFFIACLAFSGSAYEYPEGANFDIESGRLYGKVVYWQDYVTSSVQGTLPGVDGSAAGEEGWVTSCTLPGDSLWTLFDGGGSSNTETWYTNSGYTSFLADDRMRGLSWSMPYRISIEDLRENEASVFRLLLQSNQPMREIEVYVYFWDFYMNPIGSISLSRIQGNGSTVVTVPSTFYLSSDWVQAGTKYISFGFDVMLEPNVYEWVTFNAPRWDILLPVQFDPAVFKVDGIDAWMNGYFKPDVPSDNPDLGELEDGLNDWVHGGYDDALGLRDSLAQILQYYNAGFIVVRRLFGAILGISWVTHLFTVSAFVGFLAVLFDLNKDIGGAVSRSRRERRKGTERSNGKGR